MSRLVWGSRRVGRFHRNQSLSIVTRTKSKFCPNLVGANSWSQRFCSKTNEATRSWIGAASGVGVSVVVVGLLWTIANYNVNQLEAASKQLRIKQDELSHLMNQAQHDREHETKGTITTKCV